MLSSWPSPEQVNAIAQLVTTCGAVVALIIHAVRVPYRESAAQEQVAATDSMIRVRAQRTRADDKPTDYHPPPPPPSFE